MYSVWPRPGAPVSTRLRWQELDELLDPRRFPMQAALERLERGGNVFAHPSQRSGARMRPPDAGSRG
jgi:DNA primase